MAMIVNYSYRIKLFVLCNLTSVNTSGPGFHITVNALEGSSEVLTIIPDCNIYAGQAHVSKINYQLKLEP